jgi:hypothetical protein
VESHDPFEVHQHQVSALFTLLALGFACAAYDFSTAKCVLTFNSALGYAAGGISVVQDVVILLLPIPELISLRMNLKRKLNVLFMFNIGVMYAVMFILWKSRC